MSQLIKEFLTPGERLKSAILIIKGFNQYQFVDKLTGIYDDKWIVHEDKFQNDPALVLPNYVERNIRGLIIIIPISKVITEKITYELFFLTRRTYNISDHQYLDNLKKVVYMWRELEHAQSQLFPIFCVIQIDNNTHKEGIDFFMEYWEGFIGITNKNEICNAEYMIQDSDLIENLINRRYKQLLETPNY